MTKEEFLSTRHQLMTVAGVIREMRLAEFLKRIDLATGAAPVLDPSLFRAGSQTLAHIETIAHAALKSQETVLRVAGEAAAEEQR